MLGLRLPARGCTSSRESADVIAKKTVFSKSEHMFSALIGGSLVACTKTTQLQSVMSLSARWFEKVKESDSFALRFQAGS